MESPLDAVRQRLNELRKEYARALPNRVAELASAWSRAESDGWAGPHLTAACRTAHHLAGSGTTFGFPAVSREARGIEVLLQPVGEQGPPGEEVRAEIESRLEALQALALQLPPAADPF